MLPTARLLSFSLAVALAVGTTGCGGGLPVSASAAGRAAIGAKAAPAGSADAVFAAAADAWSDGVLAIYDADNSSTLSFAEYHRSYPVAEAEARGRFAANDRDGSGAIDRLEYRAAENGMSRAGFSLMFAYMASSADANEDGTLTVLEAERVDIANASYVALLRDIVADFAALDADRSGTLEVPELAARLQTHRFVRRLMKYDAKLSWTPAMAASQAEGYAGIGEMQAAIFAAPAQMDADQDGKIGNDEFTRGGARVFADQMILLTRRAAGTRAQAAAGGTLASLEKLAPAAFNR